MGEGLAARFLPVVVGSRVGDAMGTPTEGWEPEEIARRLGWVSNFEGDGTDDSLMATLLAQALVETGGQAGVDDWAAQWAAGKELVAAKRNKFFISVLHTMEKLSTGWLPRRVAAGNMASSSSAMCIWPVGLVNAGQIQAAATQAYALAGLIHVGEVDFCQDGAAAVAGAVAAGLRPGTSVAEAARRALDSLHPVSGKLMYSLISGSLALAEQSADYLEFRNKYQARFCQETMWDSRETVPAAFGLAVLAGGDLVRAVEYGANFGRDADTIASMAGAICGAARGSAPLPPAWVAGLGPAGMSSAAELAQQLGSTAQLKAAFCLQEMGTVPGLLPPGTVHQ